MPASAGKDFFNRRVNDLVSRRIGTCAQPVWAISRGRCPIWKVPRYAPSDVIDRCPGLVDLRCRASGPVRQLPIPLIRCSSRSSMAPKRRLAHASPSTGVAFLTFNKDNLNLCYAISYTPLAGTEILAHFHGPLNKGDVAGPGVASPVLHSIRPAWAVTHREPEERVHPRQ